jgi:SAM-dependent methyltransferase
MEAICPVCRSANIRNMAKFRYENPIFSNCSLAICQDCEMIFASPMPSEDMLLNYNANYFSAAHGGRPTDKLAIAFFAGIARIRHAFVSRFLKKHHIGVGKVLEVGPGPGFFARSWLADAPQTSYSALETDESCHQTLKELGVQVVHLTDVELVDLVVMSHVLEHVPDPVNFVRATTKALRPGGALFIEVPCQDWAHKTLDEPHILFFDKAPMRRLLEDLGFADIEIAYYGQTISQLRSESKLHSTLTKVRAKMISWGCVAPFASTLIGMESVGDPLERAMVAPYKAHLESIEPAWWLRAVARKT